MNRTVKWILGIVLGLVALCAVAVVGFIAFNRLGLGALAVGRRAFPSFEGRPAMPIAPYQAMPYRHFGGFSPFGFFGGWLFIAALLGLFALAVIALIVVLRRPGRPALQSAAANQPVAPLQPAVMDQPVTTGQSAAADSPGVPVMPPSPAAAGQNCPSCGRSVQADWSHCPYCGTPLSTLA